MQQQADDCKSRAAIALQEFEIGPVDAKGRRQKDQGREYPADPQKPAQKSQKQQPRQPGAQPFGDAGIQVVVDPTARDHQSRPGQGAAENIGMDRAPEGPDLQMFAQQIGNNPDAPARIADTIAELDILNRWHPVGLHIKATKLQIHIPPDCAATGPKCCRIPIRFLMVEPMGQVFVARHQALARRCVVIRAKHRMHRRIGKGRPDQMRIFGPGDHV